MLGSGYVIEHCVAAVKRKTRQNVYEVYTTDVIRAIALGLGAQGVRRFADIITPKPQENKNAEEIVDDITARAGLKVVRTRERDELDGSAGA